MSTAYAPSQPFFKDALTIADQVNGSMGKISAGRNVFMYPMPVTLLGTLVDKKPDFMALGWIILSEVSKRTKRSASTSRPQI
jgi:hypothetical protein